MRFWRIFLAGTLAGVLIVQAGAAPKERATTSRLNHVGMRVKDVDESLKFYTKTMGFREAFSVKDREGKLASVWVQISRDTFLELSQADADHPVGFSHAAISVDNVNATVDALRQAGARVDDPHVGYTKALVTNVTDPNGLQLELFEVEPESLQKKAIDSW
jgi:catechol 2,3-dioxygenase-like lactoylglutathione lyase family enzyme